MEGSSGISNYKVDSVLVEGGGVKIFSFFTDVTLEEHETQYLAKGTFKYIGITNDPITVTVDKWYEKVYTSYADQFYLYLNGTVYARTQDRVKDVTYHYYGHHIN